MNCVDFVTGGGLHGSVMIPRMHVIDHLPGEFNHCSLSPITSLVVGPLDDGSHVYLNALRTGGRMISKSKSNQMQTDEVGMIVLIQIGGFSKLDGSFHSFA